MKTTPARLAVRTGVVVTALGVSLALTGCIQSSSPLPGARPTSTSSASATPTASPTPSSTSTPSPAPTGGTVVEDCGILLTPAQVYTYNANYVRDTAYTPKAGSVPAAVAALGGQTCAWVDETSGSQLEVALAIPSASRWKAARAAASGGTPITEAGEHGYFAVTNGVGSAQFFFGSLWLDVSSADFVTAGDASAVYPTVVENQVHAGG